MSSSDKEDAAAATDLHADLLRSILDQIGEGVVAADESGRIIVFNPAAERMVGLGLTRAPEADWPRIYGVFLPDGSTLYPAEDLPLARAVRGEPSDQVELLIRNPTRPDGVCVSATARPLRDAGGRPRGGVLVIRDITEQRRAETAMAKSSRLLELFFSQSLDGFFFMMIDEPVRWGPDVDREAVLEYVFSSTRMTKVNDAMLAQYGASREQFIGLTPRDFYAHDLEQGKRVWRRFFDAGQLHVETDERRLDGTPVRIEGDYICFHDESGRITGHFGIQHDVTERHRAGEEMRRSREELRALAARLQSVREEERRRIAREIHDELGQALTGLKIDLAWLRGRLSERQPELVDWSGSVLARVDDTLSTVRRIATELRPSVLDHLGLADAAEWQVSEFERRTGMVVSLDLPSEALELDDDVATNVFRILQEALTNVARHSRAQRVEVELGVSGGELRLRVRDDGRGIGAEEMAGVASLGLAGLRERAIACKGDLTIASAPNEGTTVALRVPLRRPQDSAADASTDDGTSNPAADDGTSNPVADTGTSNPVADAGAGNPAADNGASNSAFGDGASNHPTGGTEPTGGGSGEDGAGPGGARDPALDR